MTVSGGRGERWGTEPEAALSSRPGDPGETRARAAASAKSLSCPHLQSPCPADTNAGGNSEGRFLLRSRGAVFFTSGLCALGLTPHNMKAFTAIQCPVLL